MRELIKSYEHSLAMVTQRISELNAQKNLPGISPRDRDGIEIRIRVLREERLELKRDIGDMQSYLRARGDLE